MDAPEEAATLESMETKTSQDGGSTEENNDDANDEYSEIIMRNNSTVTRTTHQSDVYGRDNSNSNECCKTLNDCDQEDMDVDVTGTPYKSPEQEEPVDLTQEGMALRARQNKDDVLSVVIQKLTELVKSSQAACPQAGDSDKSRGSSGGNTPPQRVPVCKKKPRPKRQNKTQLYKCPGCPCLFAIRKRDLKKGRKILCSCCEKLKQAASDSCGTSDRTPLQVVPLESWKVICEVCSHWVSDYSSLLYHLASHSGVQIFKCKLCDFVTTKQKNIESHQSIHQPKEVTNKFICNICSKFATNDLAKMEEHLKAHDQKKLLVLKCSVCGYTCRSEEVLRYHMVTHVMEEDDAAKESQRSTETSCPENGQDMPFKCSMCMYSCDKLSTLKSHSWRHAGDQSCSYPVEAAADGKKTSDPEQQKTEQLENESAQTNQLTTNNTRATVPAQPQDGETPDTAMLKDKDSFVENHSDISRLAIGCCGPKGQTFCSKEASDKCHCKSFDVPEAQQPMLKVFFNEIVSKSNDGEDKGKPLTNMTNNEPEPKVVTEVLPDTGRALFSNSLFPACSNPSKMDADDESDGDKVEEVLEECSTLMNRFDNSPGQSTPPIGCKTTPKESEQGNTEGVVCEGISCIAEDQSSMMSVERVPKTCGLDSAPDKSDVNQGTVLSADDDGDYIVIVENVNVDNILGNTGSVVEVTTSVEPDHMVRESSAFGDPEGVPVAKKRSVAPHLEEEPRAKRQELESSSIADSLVEMPTQTSSNIAATDSNMHKDVHEGPNKLICPFCNECLSDFKNFKKHLLDHCREEVLKCQKCPSKFGTEALLAKHQCEHDVTQGDISGDVLHGENGKIQTSGEVTVEPCSAGSRPTGSNRKCLFCDRKFRTKASLYLHEQECTKEKKEFPCIECDFIANSRDDINKHLAESHKKPFKCALCDYISATPSGIKNHMKFHAVDKRYKCHLCSFSGAYPQSLKSHLKTHASCAKDVKVPCEQYKCKLCGYSSCHLPSMKSHMWRHAQDPGFDYNARLDEIMKDATPMEPQGESPVKQSGVIVMAPMLNPPPGKVANQPVKVPSAEAIPEKRNVNPGVAAPVLIFKCTQCGFQSSTRESLIEHLRGHLAADNGQGVKLG